MLASSPGEAVARRNRRSKMGLFFGSRGHRRGSPQHQMGIEFVVGLPLPGSFPFDLVHQGLEGDFRKLHLGHLHRG